MLDIRVVIVEDDEFLLKKITKVLQREVDQVFSFNNPKDALEKIPQINPHIIVSDINMPHMSGLDMYKELKDRNLNIPIILASAFSEPEFFIEAIKLKVKNFIVKPIDLEDLIDELKQFEHELMNEQENMKRERILTIQSKMAAMGEMLANIAHQWKQPLNTISICASGIQLNKELGNITDKDNTLTDAITNITHAVEYMSTTISDFQNYLKPNKIESCFFLKETFEKIEKLTVSQCISHNIQLTNTIDKDIYLCTFQNELIQAIINIKKNAIDELEHLNLEHKLLNVDAFEKEDEIYITIHDNAGGVPEKILPKIFEPYFTTKNDQGTGIGLYMCKQIIENHLQGSIEVCNAPLEYEGQTYMGAKFTIKLKPGQTPIMSESEHLSLEEK